jgi:hypothetical protein
MILLFKFPVYLRIGVNKILLSVAGPPQNSIQFIANICGHVNIQYTKKAQVLV